MKKMNRKAALLLVMVALLLTVTVGTTVAYLKTSTPTVTNTFEPGRVSCAVVETLNGVIKQDVKIKNTGNVPAYVRAAIVVTWKDKDGKVYPKAPVARTDYTIGINGTNWEVGSSSDNFYYYKGTVAANSTTENLINSCQIQGDAPTGYSLNVEILAQAIQADGMGATSAQQAWQIASGKTSGN